MGDPSTSSSVPAFTSHPFSVKDSEDKHQFIGKGKTAAIIIGTIAGLMLGGIGGPIAFFALSYYLRDKKFKEMQDLEKGSTPGKTDVVGKKTIGKDEGVTVITKEEENQIIRENQKKLEEELKKIGTEPEKEFNKLQDQIVDPKKMLANLKELPNAKKTADDGEQLEKDLQEALKKDNAKTNVNKDAENEAKVKTNLKEEIELPPQEIPQEVVKLGDAVDPKTQAALKKNLEKKPDISEVQKNVEQLKEDNKEVFKKVEKKPPSLLENILNLFAAAPPKQESTKNNVQPNTEEFAEKGELSDDAKKEETVPKDVAVKPGDAIYQETKEALDKNLEGKPNIPEVQKNIEQLVNDTKEVFKKVEEKPPGVVDYIWSLFAAAPPKPEDLNARFSAIDIKKLDNPDLKLSDDKQTRYEDSKKQLGNIITKKELSKADQDTLKSIDTFLSGIEKDLKIK